MDGQGIVGDDIIGSTLSAEGGSRAFAPRKRAMDNENALSMNDDKTKVKLIFVDGRSRITLRCQYKVKREPSAHKTRRR